MSDPVLYIEKLAKHFEQQIIFEDLSLSLQPGEIAAITGPSGSGKTTLLNIVAGLDFPDHGSITINQQAVIGLNEQERTLLRRRDIGFIFQFFNLIPTLTVLENCLLPLELNGQRLGTGNSAQQAIEQQLERIGLLSKKEQFPENLSGGEQQRVAIIRALSHQPKLLLADEPTGNLDHETAETVTELLCQEVKQSNASLLVVTHSDALAARADSVYKIDQHQLKRL